MSEQLELFSPAVKCTACGKPTYSPFNVDKIIKGVMVRLAFCSEAEANEYYLEQLRKAGH